MPFALSNYIYGLTSVEFLPYLAATGLGFFPGTLAYVSAGDAAKMIGGGATEGAAVPGYTYALALAFVVAFTKVVTDISKNALEEINDETSNGG